MKKIVFYLSFLILGALIFVLSWLIANMGITSSIDPNTSVLYYFQQLRSPEHDRLMTQYTLLSTKDLLAFPIVGLTLLMLWRHQFSMAFHWLGGLALTILAVYTMNTWFDFPHPPGLLHHTETNAFPSAHAMFATTTYLLFALFCAFLSREFKRWQPFFIASLLTASILSTRLYLNDHWLLDITAGIGLSIIIVTITAFSWSICQHKQVASAKPVTHSQLLGVFVISLLTGAMLIGPTLYEKEQLSHQPQFIKFKAR